MRLSQRLTRLLRQPLTTPLLLSHQRRLASTALRSFDSAFRLPLPHRHTPLSSPLRSKSLLRAIQRRHESSLAVPQQHSDPSSTPEPPQPRPEYQLTFTCKKCSARTTHRISKQGYHNGTVLVQCPSCKNRHLIADHLKIFSDQRITLEDILAANGEVLKKGHLELKMVGNSVVEVEREKEMGIAETTTE